MCGFKTLPFLVLLFLCLAFTYSQFLAEDIPIPDTAPPSRPPSDIGSDYGNDGCPDWRLHHQHHLRQGYPGQYGGIESLHSQYGLFGFLRILVMMIEMADKMRCVMNTKMVTLQFIMKNG